MTQRGVWTLADAVFCLFLGLMFGYRIFYALFIVAAVLLLYGFLTVHMAKKGIRIFTEADKQKVSRQERFCIRYTAECSFFLPIRPAEIVTWNLYHDRPDTVDLKARKSKTWNEYAVPAHVGLQKCGIVSCKITDVFGLFSTKISCDKGVTEILVLPNDFSMDPVKFYSNDEGKNAQNRVSEDLSSPDSIRSYRPGDPLKRIHWKLSARKRELIARSFETPAPPETLILTDFSGEDAEIDIYSKNLFTEIFNKASGQIMQDSLRETVLSAALAQLKASQPVRIPFYGERMTEFAAAGMENIAELRELLARQRNNNLDFAGILRAEMRRMRKTGATVLILSKLNAEIVEEILHIRRMGPAARVCLITQTPDSPEDMPYIRQLQMNLVEVCYVTPA